MIVPAQKCHVCKIAATGLRAEDIAEIKAASGMTPEAALHKAFDLSTKAWAMVDGPKVIAVFGVAPFTGSPSIGIPWLLCTDDFVKHKGLILSNTKRIVALMGEGYEYLSNYTDLRHTNNLGWLMWAGFRFDQFHPEYGVEKRPFLRFTKDL